MLCAVASRPSVVESPRVNSTSDMPRQTPWPHRLAVALLCATFPLIWIGGLVTTMDAGMAVEDWPTTYGYNLFLYPWDTWIFGPFDLFIEHGHRLLGSLVGFITIGLVFAVFLGDRRAWMKVVAVIALLGVIGQGVLGGMRVLFDDRQLAMIHGCVGPAFFALVVAITTFTSHYWHEAQRYSSPSSLSTGRKVQRLSLITLGLAYLQLVLGAGLRHMPIDATAGYFKAIVLFHLLMAAALAVHAVLLFRATRGVTEMMLARRGVTIAAFVFFQIALGTATWVVKYGWPSWFADYSFAAGYTVETNSWLQVIVTTMHVANGSMILAHTTAMTIGALRVFPFLGTAEEEESGESAKTLHSGNAARGAGLTHST